VLDLIKHLFILLVLASNLKPLKRHSVLFSEKWGYLLTKAPFIHEHAYMQVL